MKERTILLFCLMVLLLSACVSLDASVPSTPTPTSTLLPHGLHIYYVKYEIIDGKGVATVELSLGSIKQAVRLQEEQRVCVEVWYREELIRVRLRLDNEGIIHHQIEREEEKEWRVPNEYEPLQL